MPLTDPARELDPLYTLLPSNATALEQDVLKITPFTSILQEAVAEMNAVGVSVFPDDWKLWILQQRGQLPLLDAIEDLDGVILSSKHLVEHRGTIEGIVRVCRLLGHPYVSVWEHEWSTIHFSEFHVYLNGLVSQNILVRLEKAINFIKPARSRLRRIYSGTHYDVRRLVLSTKKGKQNGGLGAQTLGHFSGNPSVHNPELWICLKEDNGSSYALGASISLTSFPYVSTGITSGTMITEEWNDIVNDEDSFIAYVLGDAHDAPPEDGMPLVPSPGYVFVYHYEGQQIFNGAGAPIQVPEAFANSFV